MKRYFYNLTWLSAIVLLLQACTQESVVPNGASSRTVQQDGQAAGGSTARTQSDNLLMGNPSNATANTANPSNYLLSKLQYAVSYNRDLGKPNWVSWHLDRTWIGSTARQDNFSSDATLPSGWYRVTSSSYTGSGFDRGHNCPSADRTYSVADNSATFLMTNMMPQAPTNNQQTWARLEDYARTLVNQGNELYIICGSYGVGGTGSNGYKTTIDNGRVTVPARTWKALLVLPQGTNDLSRVTSSTRVIAVDMPNSNSINTSWGTYRTTVDAIEAATGYNLFSAVSTTLQATLESRVDNGPTQ